MSPTETSFQTFKARFELWKKCFHGDDTHSIIQQIYRLAWNWAIYNVINEGKKIAPRNKHENAKLNGAMYGLLDHAFFQSQMAAIRRLTDACPLESDDRKWDVVSLISLLSDMEKQSEYFTRENIFAVRGIEYDIRKTKQAENKFLETNAEKGQEVTWIPEHFNWELAASVHMNFDKMSGSKPDSRSPKDRIKPELIQCLKKRAMSACNNINSHVNKFIAHSATVESRQQVNPGELTVTLDEFNNAVATLCTTAYFIDYYLLTGAQNYILPFPEPRIFEYMDKPLVSTENIGKLVDAWKALDQQTKKWLNPDIDEIVEEAEQYAKPRGKN